MLTRKHYRHLPNWACSIRTLSKWNWNLHSKNFVFMNFVVSSMKPLIHVWNKITKFRKESLFFYISPFVRYRTNYRRHTPIRAPNLQHMYPIGSICNFLNFRQWEKLEIWKSKWRDPPSEKTLVLMNPPIKKCIVF